MGDWLRVETLEDGKLTFALVDGFVEDPTADIRDALLRLTGNRWDVEKLASGGSPSLRELEEVAKADAQARMRAHPMVEAAFAAFPDAELVEDDNSPASGDRAWSKRA